MVQAQALRRTFRAHGTDPAAFALAYDEATERDAAPFYWNQIRADRIRLPRSPLCWKIDRRRRRTRARRLFSHAQCAIRMFFAPSLNALCALRCRKRR